MPLTLDQNKAAKGAQRQIATGQMSCNSAVNGLKAVEAQYK